MPFGATPYQQAGGILGQLGQSLTANRNLEARLALNAAIANARQAEMAKRDAALGMLQGAQTQSALSLSALNASRKAEIDARTKAAMDFGVALNPMPGDNAFPGPSPMQIQTAGQLAGFGRQHIMENLAQALELANPRMRALIATGTHPLQSMGPEDIAMDPTQAGVPVYAGGRHLAADNLLLQGGVPGQPGFGTVLARGVAKPTANKDPRIAAAGELNKALARFMTPEGLTRPDQIKDPVTGEMRNTPEGDLFDAALGNLTGILKDSSLGTRPAPPTDVGGVGIPAPLPRGQVTPPPAESVGSPAPVGGRLRSQNGNMFQEQPNGEWKYVGPAQ